jgi:hypothetical protein
MMKLIHGFLTLLLFPLCALAGGQGQFVTRGDVIIHYAAVNTLEIPASTARALGVTRSGNRALLVLNAQQSGDDGQTTPLPATARGSVRNLLGQDKNPDFRPVEDQGVWYVLADFPISERERIRFDLEVTPEGATSPIPLRFEQTFYRGR